MVTDGTAKLASDAATRLDATERRLVARMPLHAITSVHGEAGLRERLLIEIAQFPAAGPRPDRRRAGAGIATARRGTGGSVNRTLTTCSGSPSGSSPTTGSPTPTWHAPRCCTTPSRTMPRTSRPAAPGRPRSRALARQFGHRTADLVAAVTNPVYEPGRDEHEQYREHVAASLLASPWARVIKASDFTDNAVGLIHTTGPKLSKLAGKYRPLVPVLRELILRPDTPLDSGRQAHDRRPARQRRGPVRRDLRRPRRRQSSGVIGSPN